MTDFKKLELYKKLKNSKFYRFNSFLMISDLLFNFFQEFNQSLRIISTHPTFEITPEENIQMDEIWQPGIIEMTFPGKILK